MAILRNFPPAAPAASEGAPVKDERKFRVAIGVFDDVAKLHCALDEFGALGLAAGQVALVANAGALSGQLEVDFASDQSDGKPQTPRLIIRGKAGCLEITETGMFAGETTPAMADQVTHFDRWMTPRLADELNDHLAQGGCVLIAPVATALREQKISEILLSHSANSVQLHDWAV